MARPFWVSVNSPSEVRHLPDTLAGGEAADWVPELCGSEGTFALDAEDLAVFCFSRSARNFSRPATRSLIPESSQRPILPCIFEGFFIALPLLQLLRLGPKRLGLGPLLHRGLQPGQILFQGAVFLYLQTFLVLADRMRKLAIFFIVPAKGSLILSRLTSAW